MESRIILEKGRNFREAYVLWTLEGSEYEGHSRIFLEFKIVRIEKLLNPEVGADLYGNPPLYRNYNFWKSLLETHEF